MYQLDICPEYIVTHFSELSTLSRRLKICPNGSKIDKVKGLSLYLMPYNWEGHSSKSAVYAQYKLRLLDQISGKHYEKEGDSHSLTRLDSNIYL